MDQEAIMSWLYSFDGVTEETCPNYDSLREGHVLATIYNQLSDNPNSIDISSLQKIDKSKDDWFNCLKNLKAVTAVVKDPFSAAKVMNVFDVTSIARRNKPESLNALVSSFVLFSLKGPKKTENVARLKGLPKNTQSAVKDILKASQASKASPATPTKPPAASTAKPASSGSENALSDSQEVRLAKIRLELQLKKLETQKNNLIQENSDLKHEKEKLLAEPKRASANSGRASDLAKLHEAQKKKEEAEKMSKILDEDIAKLEPVREQKQRLQSELDAFNIRLKELRRKANQSAPTIESFRDSTDPTAIKLLAEIDEAEKMVRPEYRTKLSEELAKHQKALKVLSDDVKEKKELVGDAPEVEDGDIGSQLTNELETLAERNNVLNEETLALIARAEAIDKMKNQHSFLEHIRSSSIFLKPE